MTRSRTYAALLAGTGLLALSACSGETPDGDTETPETAETEQPAASTESSDRISASMATTREQMCRSAYYDENNQLVLGGQIDLTADWCDCFVTDIPISAEFADFDTLPRDGDYMADIMYATEEIARRRDFDNLSYQDALEALQTEAAEIENTELNVLLDAVSERVTKTYADMLDESGACDRPK